MRTSWAGWTPGLLVAFLMGCAGQLETRHGDHIDVSAYPPDIQDAYEVFAVRCSRCHTLARPLNARITDDEHWIRYVARMRRQPSSGINRSNAKMILKFLLFYTSELRREEQGGGVDEAPSVIEAPAVSAEPQDAPSRGLGADAASPGPGPPPLEVAPPAPEPASEPVPEAPDETGRDL